MDAVRADNEVGFGHAAIRKDERHAPVGLHDASELLATDNGVSRHDVGERCMQVDPAGLAETEGVFTETAGGVTVAVTKKLVEQGRIASSDLTVIAITGNGLKTQEAIRLAPPVVIEPRITQFEQAINGLAATA